jgi:hypothetical protein
MNFHPFYRRDIKVNEASLNKEDLKRLFSIIQTRLDKAVDIQIVNTNPDLFNDFEAAKEEIRRAFVMYYSTNKKMGDTVSGYDTPDLDSSTFPEQLANLFLSTKSTFEIHAGFAPRNWIELLIDFRRSRVSIDFITLPSNPTENGTAVNICGLEEPWVIETYDKLREFSMPDRTTAYTFTGAGSTTRSSLPS